MSSESVPNSRRRVGVLGGTFDPIHIGHLLFAEEARLFLSLQTVVFIPAGRPWRKSGRAVSDAKDRLAMVSLAVAGNPYFEVSSLEVEREGSTFTAETLETLSNIWGPETDIWFLLGSDALLDLPNWRDPGRIVALSRLAVAARSGSPAAGLDRVEAAIPGITARIDRVPMPAVEISSTQLRERLKSSVPARYWLPPGVEEYAAAHQLYARRAQQVRGEASVCGARRRNSGGRSKDLN